MLYKELAIKNYLLSVSLLSVYLAKSTVTWNA